MATILQFSGPASRPVARAQFSRNLQNITGRDNYLTALALARYIVTERAKPQGEKAESVLQDAVSLLMATVGERVARRFVNAEADKTGPLTQAAE